MTFRDRIDIPLGNLWRIKLRSFLTISGVTIAIAAFVTLLSFGAGNQKFISDQFDELGLFSTAYVYPARDELVEDSVATPKLDDSAVAWISTLPGVTLAYPFDDHDVIATARDTSVHTGAQALPVSAAMTRLYSRVKTGRMFESDSAREAVVTTRFLETLAIEEADSALGLRLVVAVERVRLDSGLVAVMRGAGGVVDRVFVAGWMDSLDQSGYIERIARDEFGQAVAKFADGFFNSPVTVSDTLTIVGVLSVSGGDRHTEPILVPLATAEKFDAGGLTNDPTELLASLQSGGLANPGTGTTYRQYPRVTLQFEQTSPYQPIKDSIEARGYRTFSFAEQFEQISRFFVFFDLGLALLGLIALVTASLGIINTMVMAVTERRREIGVLKSLGASEIDIRVLFLFETGLIGVIGAVSGIGLGWLVSRLCSAVAQAIMTSKGIDPIDFFTLPWWLIGVALLFGLVVSVAAGAYPAARASRVDPMEALRVE